MIELDIVKKAIVIPNRNKESMYTILSMPKTEVAEKKFIVFCNAGLVNKSGSGDVFRLIADILSKQGYYVLRFDQTGVGQSKGEIAHNVLNKIVFRKIQSGVFEQDTVDVVDWIQGNYAGAKIYLLGYCGGCISAILACVSRINKISGLIFLALPVLYSSLDKKSNIMREFDAWATCRLYIKKLLKPENYVRLLRGESDFNLIKGSFVSLTRHFKKNIYCWAFRNKDGIPDNDLFNWFFWEAFKKVMVNQKKVLILMASLDNETSEFNREFKTKVLDKREDYSKLCKLHYLEKTDHSLMFEESRNYLIKLLLKWLN